MGVTTTKTNKPLNPRGNDQSPLAYNRAKLYSGKALDFDGVNDSVSVPDSDELDGFTNFTYSVIAKADSALNYCRLFDKGLDTLLGAFNLSDQFYIYVNSTLIQFDYVLKLNEYLHFTIVFTGGQDAKLYVNGVLEETKTHSIASTGTNSINFAIGANNALNGNFWDGHMSNARLFSTALTAAQVADLYNNPEKVVPTGVDNTALKLWLPMMEGAGTTAYDGSGNGNHGTISGATYVNGVGAPVSQSAVIDWNKGTNTIPESENPDNLPSFDARGFTKNSSTETSPIGTNDAHKYTEDGTNGNPALVWSGDYSTGASQTLKVYLKADAATSLALSTQGQASGGNINVTTEWQQFEVTQSVNTTSGPHIGGFGTITQGSGIVLYMWHPQLSYGDSVYIPTLATAQPNPVLLPQGLTTGRDITGVNLFENVRKQGALNLDGNSWAEVHDNASLDITSAITLECWFYDTDSGAFEGVIGKWKDSTERTYAIIKNNGSNNFLIRISTDGSAQAGPTITNTDYGWIHLVLTYDGANVKGYKNGVYQSQAALTGSIATNDKPVEIGRYGQSTGSQYNNQIAQPRIYNRALTAEEVQRNYNAGKNIYTN